MCVVTDIATYIYPHLRIHLYTVCSVQVVLFNFVALLSHIGHHTYIHMHIYINLYTNVSLHACMVRPTRTRSPKPCHSYLTRVLSGDRASCKSQARAVTDVDERFGQIVLSSLHHASDMALLRCTAFFCYRKARGVHLCGSCAMRH